MAAPFFTFTRFCRYYTRARGARWLHSPFVYDLYRKTIQPARKSTPVEIDALRKKLRKDTSPIEVIDFRTGLTQTTTPALIARRSASSIKFSNFLRLLCEHLQVKCVLETGTSLGINILNISYASSIEHAVSIEGSSILYAVARKNTRSQKNVRLINGSISEQLPEALERYQPELIFLDADHRGGAVKEHVDIIARHSSKVKAIVIHDIYWSGDMYKCWQELSSLSQYPLCIDIFQAGILFTHFQGEKQHFVLKF